VRYLTDVSCKTRRGNIKYLEKVRILARKNRENSTEAEFLMWQYLRNKKLGFKFTRQKPIDKFILDFYCSKLLLAIEIDGSSHLGKQEQDEERDRFLSLLNIKTLRFSNEEIVNDFEIVKQKLLPLIKGRCHEVTEGF
jgi:very-short-patch-repair endonuclease